MGIKVCCLKLDHGNCDVRAVCCDSFQVRQQIIKRKSLLHLAFSGAESCDMTQFQFIQKREAGGKVGGKVTRTGVEVRLENTGHLTSGIKLLHGKDTCLQLGRMMGIVVDQDDIFFLEMEVETTARTD